MRTLLHVATPALVALLSACAEHDEAGLPEQGEPHGSQSAPLLSTSPWPQSGFDQHHTGYNTRELLLGADNVAALSPLWRVSTGARPGAPSVASGRVYVGSENNTLYALAGDTGARRWRAFSNGSDVWSAPAAAYRHVYFTADDGLLYAHRAQDGAFAWAAQLEGGVVSLLQAPVVAQGQVFVASRGGFLVFDAEGCGTARCSPTWTGATASGGLRRTPVVGKDLVYTFGGDPSDPGNTVLYAFQAHGCGAPTCEPVWTFPLGDLGLSEPAYARGRLYVATSIGLMCIAADTGLLRWRNAQARDGQMPAIADRVVYVGTDHGLFALDERGAVLWHALDGAPASAPAVANGVVYVTGGERASLHAFAVGCAEGGAACAPLLSRPEGLGAGARPIVADGRVWVGDPSQRALVAYGLP